MGQVERETMPDTICKESNKAIDSLHIIFDEAYKTYKEEQNMAKEFFKMTDKFFENKYDQGKLRMDFVMPGFIKAIASVMTFATEEKGYKPFSWQEVEDPVNRYYAALMRHIIAWRDGEDYDDESRFHHMAHAACCIMIILWFELKTKVLRKEVNKIWQKSKPIMTWKSKFCGLLRSLVYKLRRH